MHAAGITLMRSDPRLVAAAIDISRRTYAKIRQNLFWVSSGVAANALLLKRWKPVQSTGE